MATTRARKLKFMATFGSSSLEEAARDMARYRPDLLTDAQLEYIVEHKAELERSKLHHKIRERNRSRRYGLVRGATMLEAAE